MDLEQYFTGEMFGNLVATGISIRAPRTALDVGAGKGDLLTAVQKRWEHLHCLGVDIDAQLNSLPHNHSRLTMDGLDPYLPNKVSEVLGDVDLIVGNPPFKSVENCRNSIDILKSVGFDKLIGSPKRLPIEVVFLAQNLRILKKNGEMAIILPEGLLAAKRWEKVRKKLLTEHKISKVIALPKNAFKNTEACTHILFLKKGARAKDKIDLFLSNEHAEITGKISININQAIHRMDYSFYQKTNANKKPNPAGFTLRELGANVFRGVYTKKDATRNNLEILHSSNLSEHPCTLSIGSRNLITAKPYAQKGDIVIARVGSRCIGRIGIIKDGAINISDGIIVIRVSKRKINAVWGSLSSDRGQSYIKSIAQGVCAKYITYDQILDYKV